ncbi:putative bifunctional diguanylate cyclase/phosphodiesterase [Muricoccus radiodurans]|uniref:putative bifunctional diguanylate cyclase/phosphodiesterase n=1 Tax=Muricoccus radiodurans TaxID=2231721 RepID=UPI003CED240B
MDRRAPLPNPIPMVAGASGAAAPVTPASPPPATGGRRAARDPGDVPGLSRDFAPARAITVFALGAALLLALAPPITWHYAGQRTVRAELVASAHVKAAVISDSIAASTELWQLDTIRLAGLLALGDMNAAESRRVLTTDGATVAELPAEVAWPVAIAREPLFDVDGLVGWVEVRRSLLPLMRQTAVIGLVSLLLGVGAYLALRWAPLRLLRQAMDRATHLASHDTLTGLPNRALLQDRLRQAVVGFRRRRSGTLCVLCLDLDHFKEVNDTLGHAAGDALLVEVALRLSACLRESDTLARLGGDEFAIVQTDVAQPHGSAALAGRLVAALQKSFDLDGHVVQIGVSIGVAVAESPEDADPIRLMQEADLALYAMKEDGRNGYRYFESPMNATLQARRALEADLRAAMAGGTLRLHFQPQVDLATRQVTGAEALLRWQHPVRGNVPPDAFIPLAERTGLIVPIGAWVLEEACRTAMTWDAPLKIAVNVSAVQFRHAGFLETVRRALDVTGLPAGRLELEITESLLLADTDEILATLNRLRDMGVAIAMDDFGTGYSSLSYLQRFRFDKVKIDRAFIRGLGEDPRAAAIVRAIVGMTEALGIRANAEGVETEAQALRLVEEGCAEVQGWLFGRPVEPGAFAELAREGLPLAA